MNNPDLQTNDSWKAAMLGLALLAALGVVCPLLAAGHIPLVDPDEGKHAAIAQEMVEKGDWIVPRLLDEPFLDKPILYFWAIAVSLKIFGMSEAAVRLPGLLFGMFGTLTTAALAWRMLGRRLGLMAGIFYASMVLPLALVQAPAHDVALIPWVNLAVLCFWEADRGSKNSGRAWGWTAAAGLVLGLAILTKGLAGAALVGIAYGGYLVVSRRLRLMHCVRAACTLTLAAIIGSSWYLAMEHSHAGFLRYYFFERHVLGFLSDSQPHGGAAWWYYLPVLLAGGLPWVAYLPVLVRAGWDKRALASAGPAALLVGKSDDIPDQIPTASGGEQPLVLLACWFVGGGLFLSLSSAKFITYIWPLFPAIAILAAVVWARKIDGLLGVPADRWMGRTVWVTCLLGSLGLPAALAVTQFALPARFSPWAWGLAVAAGLTSLAPLASWLQGRVRWTLGLAAGTVCVQMIVLLLCVFPQAAAGLSGRDLAAYFNGRGELPGRLLFVDEQLGSVVFYLRPELRGGLRAGQMPFQNINDPLLPAVAGGDDWIVVAERHLQTVLGRYDLTGAAFERAGRFRLYRRGDVESRAVVVRGADPRSR